MRQENSLRIHPKKQQVDFVDSVVRHEVSVFVCPLAANGIGSIKVTERCFYPCLLYCVKPHVGKFQINTWTQIHPSPSVHAGSARANWPHLTITLSCVMSNTRGAWQQALAGRLTNDPCKLRSAAHWKTPISAEEQHLSCSLSVDSFSCSSRNNTQVWNMAMVSCVCAQPAVRQKKRFEQRVRSSQYIWLNVQLYHATTPSIRSRRLF